MKLLRFIGPAALLIVGYAHAATVTVTPPSYTITPPKFTFTLPDSIGGPAGASVKSAAITNGHLILTMSNGTTIDAGALPSSTTDLSALNAAVAQLQSDVAALKAGNVNTGGTSTTGGGGTVVTGTPIPDPCANGAHWSKLTVSPADSLTPILACANPGFNLTLSDGTYAQVFHNGIDGTIGGQAGHADKVILDGQGGCTVDQNNGGGCSTRLAWGKGVGHNNASNVMFHDMTFTRGGSNAVGNHDGQAGLYLDTAAGPGTAKLVHVIFKGNENGVFSNGDNTQQDIVITECDFIGNSTDGGSHSAYLAGGKSLTFNNVHDYGSNFGNNQKSRISTVTYNGGFNKSVQGRWIECADGCNLTINGGQFVGNDCCQNQFGNGTESTSKGPGNTMWHGPSEIWLRRATDFANAGSFNADASVKLHNCPNGSAFNDKGGPLSGWTQDTTCNLPADPPLISLTGTAQ